MRRAIAAALLLASGAARGQPYDPAFRWWTLETPHFRLHYHQGEEEIAQATAREAERAYALLTPKLGYAPPLTEIVISDDQDDANGSATPLPYDTIRLYAVPPYGDSELQNYRNWLRGLLQHEFTHILHLDHIGGFPNVVNTIFGKVWPPNTLLPSALIEGIAVTNESEGDPTRGRNGSPLFDGQARALALSPPFPRLDEVSNPYLYWPTGQMPYVLGARFIGFLEAQYGPGAIAGWAAAQGRAIWPYAPSWTGSRWFGGKDFLELWDDYTRAEIAHAVGVRDWVRTRPVTVPKPLTRRGGVIDHPRFSPDGTFVAYYEDSLDVAPGVRRVRLDGTDLGRATIVDQNGTLALTSPREAIVAIGEVYNEFRVYDDLYRVDLETGHRQRLTYGERATDPDVGKDGTIAYVRHAGGGKTALMRWRPGERPEVIFERAGAEVYAPAIGPDGIVAFALHEGGRRDIALFKDGEVERVTDDWALDTDPTWTPDGRFLLFTSDRGGIENLYAWERATGTIRQVTNIELGAREADVSPDGRTVVFASCSSTGWDLATIPFDETTWLDPIPATTVIPPARPPTEAELSLPDPIPSRPYSAWPTVRPTYWLPVVGGDAAGPIYGALTGGTDVLAKHTYLAEGWWSAGGKEPGYALAYSGAWSWPAIDFSSRVDIENSPGPPDRLQRVWEYGNVGATFTFTQLARFLGVRLGYSGTSYQSIQAEGPIPPSWEPYRFKDGFLSEISLAARYTDARRYAHSISPEDGRDVTVALGLASPAIGSDFQLARARAAVAQYFPLYRPAHIVLALRLAGGVADGTIGGQAPFTIGGVAPVNLLSLVPGTVVAPADQLRGYPAGALGGTAFALGNLELRFPIVAPTSGYSTWPVFLRRVHGTLFLDAGDAFDLPGQVPIAFHEASLDQLRFSTGAELLLEVVLGYYITTDLRFGVARPLGAVLGAGRAADAAAGLVLPQVEFYFTIGQSF